MKLNKIAIIGQGPILSAAMDTVLMMAEEKFSQSIIPSGPEPTPITAPRICDFQKPLSRADRRKKQRKRK